GDERAALYKAVFWHELWVVYFVVLWIITEAQPRCTIPEELKDGSVVGNIVKDLGIGVSEISDHKLQIASESIKQYFSLDLENGEVVVREIIDREDLCGQSTSCVLPLQIMTEDPLQFYHVEVEIQDINDNSPRFHAGTNNIDLPESTLPGAKFLLEPAQDQDPCFFSHIFCLC
uniref:Cadherin domain-containing protein n=1 Tax=Electrophorus electricus TaxID=8005 RepID=A0A4W4DUC0_ELEEL